MFAQETQSSFLKSHISRKDFSHWFYAQGCKKNVLGVFL